MKEKQDNKKEEFDVKKDCVFYQKQGCYALEEFVCKRKECSFYKRNQMYIRK